jgi:hypothetical protein
MPADSTAAPSSVLITLPGKRFVNMLVPPSTPDHAMRPDMSGVCGGAWSMAQSDEGG